MASEYTGNDDSLSPELNAIVQAAIALGKQAMVLEVKERVSHLGYLDEERQAAAEFQKRKQALLDLVVSIRVVN